MAKAAILDVLESTIGRYVQNLDASALNVAVWSGKIELHSLQLDIGAVNSELTRKAIETPNLAIPFRVLQGSFESLRVDVPWARISSRPVVLRAKGLSILVEPFDHLSSQNQVDYQNYVLSYAKRRSKKVQRVRKNDSGSNKNSGSSKINERIQSLEIAEESRQRNNAMRKLADLDGEESHSGVADLDADPNNSSKPGFTARLVRRIIENLQFELDGIHLAMRGGGCAAGIILETLSLVTTDSNGNRTFVDRVSSGSNKATNSFLYKALSIKGLGIYCDEEISDATTSTGKFYPKNIYQQEMKSQSILSNISEGDGMFLQKNEKSYILTPLSFQAKMRQSDCVQCKEFPKYLLSSSLTSLSIMLSRTQLELMQNISQQISNKTHLASHPLFPEYRPPSKISRSTAKLWWRYAVRAIGRINRRRSWTEFIIAYRKRKSYLTLYKNYAHHETCPWLTQLTTTELLEMEAIESDKSISVQGIMNWRNIADGQVEMERKKHEANINARRLEQQQQVSDVIRPSPRKRRYISSLFGSKISNKDKSRLGASGHDFDEMAKLSLLDPNDEDHPPITLTPEEMKELESIALENSMDGTTDSLSSDSKLYDMNFTLGSFNVNLITFDSRPLASLEMGTVKASFLANADGSFVTDFSLSSLNIFDRVTSNSLFPRVVRSLQSSSASNQADASVSTAIFDDETSRSKLNSFDKAFEFQLIKSNTGDQDLVVKMVAYELVASSTLFEELKRFVAPPKDKNKTSTYSDPFLQQSISGGADLFYDAIDRSNMIEDSVVASNATTVNTADTVKSSASTLPATAKVSDKLSSAFADAWGSKLEKKTTWTIELDIHAPILVLPENCVDPIATVLVADLGNFRLVYGKGTKSESVQSWFRDRPRYASSSGDAIPIDHCTLEMEHMSFVIGQAGYIDWGQMKGAGKNAKSVSSYSQSIIEPITLSLSLGIENDANDVGKSRKCMFGILPAISLQITYSQISRIISVASTWYSFMRRITVSNQSISPLQDYEGGIGILEEVDLESAKRSQRSKTPSSTFPIPVSAKAPTSLTLNKTDEEITEEIHFSIALRKLSLKVVNDSEESIEAHLVSVVASSTTRSDASSSTRLRMGWFWILDGLKSEFPRKQRLVAHSSLPKSAESFAENENYDVMEELQRQGVINKDFSSNSLADVTITKRFYAPSEDSHVLGPVEVGRAVTLVNAKFNTLFVQWNPYAIRNLLIFKDHMMSLSSSIISTSVTPTSSHYNGIGLKLNKQKSSEHYSADDSSEESSSSLLVLNAEMKALEICFNSAIDDLPIFLMTMAGSKIGLNSSNNRDDSNFIASAIVGDFRLEIAPNGKTLKQYSTLLGLAPSYSRSLLSAKYGKGPVAMQSCTLDGIDELKTESFMDVVLSPMRFVYTHAQISTLVEYVSEGVLGAMAAKVASSAAQVAIDLAQAEATGEKVFQIQASGFDFVLPQSAYSLDHFLLHAGNLLIEYKSFPTPGEGEASLTLEEVTMKCARKESFIESPIRMTIDVTLPPLNASTDDDRAMRVEVSISRAAFLMTRRQYTQIMDTLQFNIGEVNSFLREEKFPSFIRNEARNKDFEVLIPQEKVLESLTHGGGEVSNIQRRIYMTFNIQALGLELCGNSTDDPILSIAAVETTISMRLLRDEEKTCANVTMHDLVCEDRRIVAINRHFRQLVKQVIENGDGSRIRDVFRLNYTNHKVDGSINVDLVVGNPQVVIIPDALADSLAFFKSVNEKEVPMMSIESDAHVPIADLSVKVEENDDGIETSFKKKCVDTSKKFVSLKTADCRLVLIDMGNFQGGSNLSTVKPMQLTEAIVMQGKAEARMELVSDVADGSAISSDFQIHGERMEVYTAQGRDLDNPVQILEPAKFSLFMKTNKTEEDNDQSIDVSIVTLSNIDITISMQNAALATAILSSMHDSLSQKHEMHSKDSGLRKLSEKETAQIEMLAFELDKVGDSDSDGSSLIEGAFRNENGMETQSVSHESKSQTQSWNLTLNITLPEAALTVINDLQGLDEALFKVVVRSCIFGADLNHLRTSGATGKEITKPKMVFRVHMNSSIMADYFDSHTNFWEPLLVKQWELNFKATRGTSKRFKSARLATTIDIESQPCNVSFSEQFLISLGAASSMWSVYSVATKKAIALGVSSMDKEESGNEDVSIKSSKRVSMMKSAMASNAARSLITTMPYGIENHSGLMVEIEIKGERLENKSNVHYDCPSGTIQYFRFDPARRKGVGGWRSYGQDVVQYKSISLFIDGCEIYFHHLDEEVNHTRRAHSLGLGRYIFSDVVKTGKATLIHLSSYIDIHNETSLDFRISLKADDDIQHVGLCRKKVASKSEEKRKSLVSNEYMTKNHLSKSAAAFGVPIDLLESDSDNKEKSLTSRSLIISPSHTDNTLSGIITLPPLPSFCHMAKEGMKPNTFEVTCSSTTTEVLIRQQNRSTAPDKMVIQVCCKVTLVGGRHPFVEFFLQPRTILQNKMHINVFVRTPMPHTISKSVHKKLEHFQQEITHKLAPFDSLEMYTPGPSIAITIKCADYPIGGTMTGWNNMGWIDIPLGNSSSLQKRINCFFPFVKSDPKINIRGGSEFFIAESSSIFGDGKGKGTISEANQQSGNQSFLPHRDVRTVFLSIENLGVDHTGELLFEPVFMSNQPPGTRGSVKIDEAHPFSAFSSSFHKRRITLLPHSTAMIRLLKLSIDRIDGVRRSLPFRIENVSLCEGGVDSSPIFWEDETQSGYFAYRKLSTYNQSEIHIIPEYVVFNGGDEQVRVIQSRGNEIKLSPGQMAPIYAKDRSNGLITMFDFINTGGMTSLLRVDSLGLKVSIVKSSTNGVPIGSLAIQTVIGKKDSRFVIKLGAIRYGVAEGMRTTGNSSKSIFDDDFLRFRIRWSEMEMTLNDTANISGSGMLANQISLAKNLNRHINARENQKSGSNNSADLVLDLSRNDGNEKNFSYSKVARILFDRFTVDFQRIFKDEELKKVQDNIQSPERSQLAIIIHNITITDCTASEEKTVLKSHSSVSNVFDLCIRTRGSEESGLVNVDLFDLKLAYAGGKADPIVLNTTEAFLWNLLDITSRTKKAKSELAGVDLELEWDDDAGEFILSTTDIPIEERDDVDDDGTYRPPRSDQLYKIRTARVSPSRFLVSFKRQPLSSRYQSVQNVRVSKLVNYFTTRLKFTIDKAELKFAGYAVRNMNGPADRLFEEIKAFYSSSMKRKLLHLLTATSLDDWKALTGRDQGNEEYVEGDILRLTGNLAGRSAGFIFKRVGQGLGHGLAAGTAGIGNGIQNVTEVLGVGVVGAGVNSIVSGLGEGVGDTVEGVGTGTGKLIRGAGKGVGQIVGGVGGGLELMAKGIGKGVKTGDGKAILTGLGDGVVSVGSGLVGGAESLATGAGEGVLTIGKGLVSGVQNVGKGFGGMLSLGNKNSKTSKR